MRQIGILCFVILLTGAAFSQSTATVVTGYASNWGPQVVYSIPYVPLVSTPSVQLGAPPLAVGASDATTGLATGASTSTLSLATPVVSTVFPRPVWYGSTPQTPASEAQPASPASMGSNRFEFGASTFENSRSVVQAAANSRGHKQAARVYTNDDVNRVNQKNGTVQRNGKTEQL